VVLQEVSVAALQFLDRSSAELFGKLVLSVLPEWLAIRQSECGGPVLHAVEPTVVNASLPVRPHIPHSSIL